MTLARALGRQAALRMWAEALQSDETTASTDAAEPKPARHTSSARRAAR